MICTKKQSQKVLNLLKAQVKKIKMSDKKNMIIGKI